MGKLMRGTVGVVVLFLAACGGGSVYQPSDDRLPVGEWAVYAATDFGSVALGVTAKPLGDLDFTHGPVAGAFSDVSVTLDPAEWGSDGSDWSFTGSESTAGAAALVVVHFTGAGGAAHTLSVTTMHKGAFVGTLDDRAIRASVYSE